MVKVAVVGPGAMGCLFAQRLARNGGSDVTLIDYKPDRAKRLEAQGIIVEDADGRTVQQIRCVSEVSEPYDLIILLTKAHTLKEVPLPKQTPILSLQNGLGNIETLAGILGGSHLLAGTTTEAAILLGEGHVRHVAAGITKVGAWTTCPTNAVEEVLRAGGFRYELTDAPGQILWEKAAVAAAINPLTALLGAPNGRLLQIPEVRQLMRDLVVEAVKVAATEGYRFSYSLVERAEEVCAQTADNISSMLQDIRAGKRTEIDALSGEIIRRAEQAALPTPRTRVIWQLIKGLEKR